MRDGPRMERMRDGPRMWPIRGTVHLFATLDEGVCLPCHSRTASDMKDALPVQE